MKIKPISVSNFLSGRLKSHKAAAFTLLGMLTVLVIILGTVVNYHGIFVAIELGISALTIAAVLSVFYYYIRSRTEDEVEKKEQLTYASHLTIFRGFLVIICIGLSVSVGIDGPSPAAYLVSLTFGTAGLLDLADGRLARSRSEVTEFGSRLDTETDAMSTLAGSIIVIAYGLVSPLFAFVGLARYIYLIASWMIYGENNPSDDSNLQWLNKILFMSVFVSIWISMLPITQAYQTEVLLSVIAVPFLLNFVRSFFATNSG